MAARRLSAVMVARTEPDRWVYFGGEFRRETEMAIGPLVHALHYGTGAFEGIRGYSNDDRQELYLLEPAAHYEWMERSARIIRAALPQGPDMLVDITRELLRRNAFAEDVYVRPLLFKATQTIGVRLHGLQDQFLICAMPFGDYVDTAKGLNCCVSSWRRVPDEVIPARGKLTGSYLNAALAKSDALESGFDEAILLTQDGHVSEGSAENVFMLRAEEWATPPVTDDILEGVTRRLLMTLMSEDLGMRVVQRSIDRSELFVCEELFLCGTGAQVAPVIAVDHRKIGGTGGVGVQTSAIQERYFKVVRGDVPARFNWLVPTYAEPLARP